MPFEVRVDCPSCRVEGARVETWEAEVALGVKCRLCDHGVPRSLPELEQVLGSWAAEEGLGSAGELVDAYFCLPTPAAILDALSRGEVVETTFDVIDYLFSSGGGGGGAVAVDEPRAPPASLATEDAPPPTLPMPAHPPDDAPASAPLPPSIRRLGGPRDELLALASVAASDGEASPQDLELLGRAAEIRGLPPLAPEEIRVRRPFEIDPPATLVQREKLLEEMFWMAWSDEELDESEVRVVRDFARAWGVDPQRVTEWTATATSRGSSKIALWFDRVGYFLFPGW